MYELLQSCHVAIKRCRCSRYMIGNGELLSHHPVPSAALVIDNMHYILYVHLGDGQPTMYIWLIYCSSQLHKQCIVYIHSKLCPSSNMHEIKNDGFIHWSTLTLPITVRIYTYSILLLTQYVRDFHLTPACMQVDCIHTHT